MPAFANISPEQVHSLVNYLVYGQKEMPSPSEPAPNIKYRFTGYKRFLDPEGYPAVAPPWGTLNASATAGLNPRRGDVGAKGDEGQWPSPLSHLAQSKTRTFQVNECNGDFTTTIAALESVWPWRGLHRPV